MFLRSSANPNYRIIFYDLETTGFNIFQNSIIEIAAVDNKGNKFEQLISFDSPLPKRIVEITKITDDMLLNKPNITQTLNSFVNFIRDEKEPNKKVFMVGHNSNSFDMPFLKAQCAKHNIKFPNVLSLDTMRMSQYILTDQYSHSLASLCNLFGISNQNAHRAMSDVNVTMMIFDNLSMMYKQKHKKCTINNLYYTTSF